MQPAPTQSGRGHARSRTPQHSATFRSMLLYYIKRRSGNRFCTKGTEARSSSGARALCALLPCGSFFRHSGIDKAVIFGIIRNTFGRIGPRCGGPAHCPPGSAPHSGPKAGILGRFGAARRVLRPEKLIGSGIEAVITGLTRNQFVSNHTRVRIPPAAPNKRPAIRDGLPAAFYRIARSQTGSILYRPLSTVCVSDLPAGESPVTDARIGRMTADMQHALRLRHMPESHRFLK